MTTYDYRGTRTRTVAVSGDRDHYHVAESGRIVAAVSAFEEAEGTFANSYQIDGTIRASGYGLYLVGNRTAVTIGQTGVMEGGTAVALYGSDSTVVNNGDITSSNDAITAYGFGAIIRNNGDIAGSTGLSVSGNGSAAFNSEHGQLFASDTAFYSFAAAGETVRFVNRGLVVAAENAVEGGNEDTYVRNSGRMIGDIDLGGGDNIVNLMGGILKGGITGGSGTDVLYTDRSRYQLTEQADGGTDSVYSTASYILGENVEYLFLQGKANITGDGNNSKNTILGTAGNNILHGWGDSDLLIGAGGDDHLFGDAGYDAFSFEKNHGRDIIEDFDLTEDVMYIDQWIKTPTFQQVLDHTRDVDGNAVVQFGDDSICILGVHKADLNFRDFNIPL